MDRSRPDFRPRFLSFFRQFIPPRHIHPSSSVSGGSTDAVGDTNQQRVSRFPHSPWIAICLIRRKGFFTATREGERERGGSRGYGAKGEEAKKRRRRIPRWKALHYQRAEKKRFLQAAAIRRFLHARTWPLVELLSLPDVKNINFPKVTLMLLEPDKRWPGQSAPESSQPPPRSIPHVTRPIRYPRPPTLPISITSFHLIPWNCVNMLSLREREEKKETRTKFRSMKKARKEGKIRSRDRFSETRIRKILFDSMNRRNGIQKTRGGRERERMNEKNFEIRFANESLGAKNFLRGKEKKKKGRKEAM